MFVFFGRLLPSASFTGDPWHFILERRGVPGEQGCLDQWGKLGCHWMFNIWKIWSGSANYSKDSLPRPLETGTSRIAVETSRTPQKSGEMVVEPSM